jgi:hypothetical protein
MELTSNPYVRSLLLGMAWLVTVVITSFSQHPGTWADYPRQRLLLLVLVSAITAGQLGVIASHFEKMRTWTRLVIGTIVGWFLVLGLLLLVGKLFANPPAGAASTTVSIDATMTQLANEAVKWVQQDRNVTLDYSPASVMIIEEELDRLHKANLPKEGQSNAIGLTMGYGAYVGEVIRRQSGGTWGGSDTASGQKTFALNVTNPKATLFPVDWCYQRLAVGPTENVYQKFSTWTTTLTNQPAKVTNSVPEAR